jgi:hypothetical protein
VVASSTMIISPPTSTKNKRVIWNNKLCICIQRRLMFLSQKLG